MTEKQRVVAALTFKESDIVPYTIAMGPVVEEKVRRWYGSDEWKERIRNHVVSTGYPLQFELTDLRNGCKKDEYGAVWRFGSIPELVKPALVEPTLKGYRFPDPDCMLDEAQVRREIADSRDRFVVGRIGFGLFERSWIMRGFAEVLADMVENPSFVDELLDRILETQLRMVDRLLDLPIDGVMFSDDWGYQRGVIMGPRHWRRFIKPRARRLFGRVKRAGKFTLQHCCGSVSEIMPEIIEIGLDCLESVQPEAMDVFALKAQYGRRISFWGGIGSQSLLPHGTPDEIRRTVRRYIDVMAAGGGYILSSAKPLMDDVPVDNAIAFIETVVDQGGRAAQALPLRLGIRGSRVPTRTS